MSPAVPASAGLESTQRIDKWLWFARVVKSRTLAAGLVSAGKVRVNRQRVDKPGHGVRRGDVITVAAAARVRVLRILAPGTRRGPASEAATLYEELTPSPSPVREEPDGRNPRDTPGRPTKRDRRILRQMNRGD
jgi:ribosome-associated heat shock protein Hsp15